MTIQHRPQGKFHAAFVARVTIVHFVQMHQRVSIGVAATAFPTVRSTLGLFDFDRGHWRYIEYAHVFLDFSNIIRCRY